LSEVAFPTVYQLKVVLLGVSPTIWRRLLVRSDCTLNDCHYILADYHGVVSGEELLLAA
jgi:hypothetical protein